MALLKGLQDALQQYGYNRQQLTPLMGGEAKRGTSVAYAFGSGLVGPEQVYAADNPPSTSNEKLYSEPFVGPAYDPNLRVNNTAPTTNTSNTGNTGGGSSGPDLSNPVKRTDYARSLGYDTWDQYINANQQQAPRQPSFEDLYGDAFRQAFEAVNQMQGVIQSGYQAELSGAELGTQQRKEGLQSEQAMRLADFARQRAEAQGQVGLANQRAETQTREGQADTRAQTESVIEQARRQAAELMQGIQARYGGTTGTGRFTSEILGSQATRNIAQNQASMQNYMAKTESALRQYKAQMDSELQNTMGKIGQAENELKTKVTSLINQEDQNLQQAKIQLRANLDKSLADLTRERSMLETEKANKRYEILNDYQNRLDQVERYNLDHKRQLEGQYQQQQNEINLLKQQAQQSYQVKTTELDRLSAAQLNNFTSSGILTPQQAFQQAQNTGYIDEDLIYQGDAGIPAGGTSSGLKIDPDLAEALGM